MERDIRCAVLGLGRLGYWHAENLTTKVKGAEVVYVVDPLYEVTEKVAKDLGIKKWATRVDDIVMKEIDAVIISTPTSTHKDLIQLFSQQGKHIFVEKPLTQDIQEALEVVEIVQKHHVLCQVGFMRRFDPSYMEAKRRILAGDIGEPVYFKAISRDPGSPPPSFIKKSGGIFIDMSIHDYDMARFLLGAEVTSVSSHGKTLIHSFMEECNDVDQALTYLTFSSNALGDIEGSRNAYYGYDIRAEVIGTEGSLFIGSLQHQDVHILTPKGGTYNLIPGFKERFKDAYLLEMIHFITCVQKGVKPSVDEVDGMKALEIGVAAKESLTLGKTIYLGDTVPC